MPPFAIPRQERRCPFALLLGNAPIQVVERTHLACAVRTPVKVIVRAVEMEVRRCPHALGLGVAPACVIFGAPQTAASALAAEATFPTVA